MNPRHTIEYWQEIHADLYGIVDIPELKAAIARAGKPTSWVWDEEARKARLASLWQLLGQKQLELEK